MDENINTTLLRKTGKEATEFLIKQESDLCFVKTTAEAKTGEFELQTSSKSYSLFSSMPLDFEPILRQNFQNSISMATISHTHFIA